MEKIGDAFKKAVEEKPQEPDFESKKRRPESLLLNKNRREIFSALCTTPCITTANLETLLSLSRPTIAWHLKLLEEAGYVESLDHYGKSVYLPQGMLLDKGSKTALALLNHKTANAVFKAILTNPGISTSDLIDAMEDVKPSGLRSILAKLESDELVNALKDGPNLRYYPAETVKRLASREKSSIKKFRAILVKRLEKEHLSPEISEIKGRGIVINLKIGNSIETMEIPYYPIERVLAQ